MSASGAWVLVAAGILLAPLGNLAPGDLRSGRRWRSLARMDGSLPLVLDLAAAALRSGRPVADALALAAPAGEPETAAVLDRVARLLRLGADPAHAWTAAPRDGPLAALSVVAVRSAASGLKLAAAFERLASEIRAERAAAAAQRAHRAGVKAMGPLAACFLPSFVCLGIVPVVVGVARTALHSVP